MRAFVVLGLVFPMPSQEIGLGKRLDGGNVSEMTHFVSSGT